MSYYDELEVDPGAGHDRIRRAYLDLARRHHPDAHGRSDAASRVAAEQRMRRINEAWAVLGDERRRRAYDRGRRDAAAESPRVQWTPFEADDPDEPDPRDLIDDVPYGPGSGLPRFVQLLPPALILVAVAGFAVALVTGGGGVVALAVVALVLGGLSFLVAPFLAVLRSRRSELEGGG